jgi:hypothetical protein
MNRRSFISVSLAAAMVGSLPLLVSKGNKLNVEKNTEQLIEKLLCALRDRRSGVYVGTAILNEPGSTLSIPKLVISIMDNLGLTFNKLASMTKSELIARLDHQTTVDFDSGAIIRASGWMLGQTEAQLCILAARSQLAKTLSVTFDGSHNV